jgi:hypothetical protein
MKYGANEGMGSKMKEYEEKMKKCEYQINVARNKRMDARRK